MLSRHLLALAFTVVPSLVSAALFPPDSMVKMIGPKAFKKVMKTNDSTIVAFVAPWCGHCQKLVPELSTAALGLYPLISVYAVDCDADKNKKLCSEQGVQGFPTIKLFPRGNSLPPTMYEAPDRTASGLYYFATRGIPQSFTKLYYDHDISPWVEKYQNKHRALLLRKDKNPPLLWQILANKYRGQLEFGTHRDRNGVTSVNMGLEAGEKKESKVLLYPAGSTSFVRYQGINKLDSLSKFLNSVLDGTADLSAIIEETKAEEYVVDEEELEIQRKQEAQRIALLHGGFNDLIDFEKALKNGAGAGFHDTHGYAGPGVIGGIPEHFKKKPSDAGVTPDITTMTDAATATATTASTTPGLTNPEVAGHTATPLPAQKEDEVAKEPVAAPESIKAPEPVVEDKKVDAKDSPRVEEETISEQVVLEVPRDHDAERPKDEL
ncbi:protein disulfide isomerase [Phlegmacium glaucopus]|nr:protein disulfide isomerase [Phlegmacium glaucopus]